MEWQSQIHNARLDNATDKTGQSYRVSGLCPLSGILNTRKHNVLEASFVSVLR
jgi:hypothetical protein